ncbi:MAG: hypothetical protein ACR2OZ_05685 [Verrucomicrobiales bacterium]
MKSRLSVMAALALSAVGVATEARADHWYGGYHCRPVYRAHCAPVYRVHYAPAYCDDGYYAPTYRYYRSPYRTAYYGGGYSAYGYGRPYRSAYYGGYAGYPSLHFGVSLGGNRHYSSHHRHYSHRRHCR